MEDKLKGLGEVLCMGILYWLLVQLAAMLFPDPGWYSNVFHGVRETVASGFTRSALAQVFVIVILVLVFQNRSAIESVKSLTQSANAAGWSLAIGVSLLQAIVLIVGWIDHPGRVMEISLFSISMSIVPAMDGFTQEIMFRGYVLNRLKRAGVSKLVQAMLSGLFFSALHFDYGGSFQSGSLMEATMPIVGTFGLGVGYAVAVQLASYRLLPVVISHMSLIVVIQPWLALSYLK